jgi:tetratricopeptide (TPR) repeat protein
MNPRQTLLFLALFSVTGIGAQEARAYSNKEFAQVITPQEARIDQFRTAEIKQLNLVLTRSSAREKKPELLLRLAELYTEKYRLFFLKENEIWNKKMDAYLQQPVERQKRTRKPVLDLKASRQWLSNAVKVLERIPMQKASFSRIDEVYYFLGFNYWELGNKKKSIAAFEKIVHSYPKSRFVSEADRYIADYSFANRDFRKSRDYYLRALKSGTTPARPRILYGLGWSYFKMKDYRKAVDTMKQAIQLGRNNEEAAKAGLALQSDAADALALFYSEGGRVEEAAEFFTDLFGEAESGSVLRKLAETYQRQGEYAKALALNKQLLSMGGAAAKEGEEQRFSLMVSSLNMTTSKNSAARRAALLKSMTAEFVTNAKEPDPEKVEILRSQVRKLATIAHKEGNKSGNSRAAFARAENLYRLYLSAFGSRIKPDDAAEIHFYLADVLSQLGRHREAATEYKRIMDLADSESAYAKYKKDAAAGLVFSLDSYLKSKGKKNLSKEDGDEVIAAIDAYVRAYPDDKDATEYLSRAAGILVTSNRMDEARPRLMDMIGKYPRSKDAWDAADTLLRDAEKKKDFEASEKLAESFLANGSLMAQDKKGVFRRKLEAIVSRSQFQQVREVEQGKNYGQAAQEYEKLAADAKDREVRVKALNNAAVNYNKAGDRENEMRLYRKILETHPGDDKTEKSMLGIANGYFLSGRYSDAADVYEQFYHIYEKHLGKLKGDSQKTAMESLRSAALLRRALKQSDKAGDDFRDIVEAANKGIGSARDAAGDFLFDVAKRLRDEGNTPEAIRSFQKYASAFPSGSHAVGATMETALLYEKLREDEKAQNYLRATISKTKSKGKRASLEELGYAARARLALLGPLEEAFEKSPLRLPEQQLKKDINNKLAALERLNKGYVEVMEFGDGTWGVEAFRRMALAYRAFGQKLENAPVPEKYSPEEKAKFKAQLKNVARPVFLKVGETLETAMQKGEQLQVVGPVMAQTYILAVLSTANPDHLPLIQTEDWSKPAEWIMGDVPDSGAELEQKQKTLRDRPSDVAAWVAIGNHHIVKGEFDLAEIFYLQAIQRNPKNAAALNNLAYLRGREGDLAVAMGGFKQALAHDEFAVPPKKNMARLQMASGLWRHASLAYRQLEVRSPGDKEVKRGIALSHLAMGHVSGADSGQLSQIDGENGKFAEAIQALAKGDRAKASSTLESMDSPYAKLILDVWNTKEND